MQNKGFNMTGRVIKSIHINNRNVIKHNKQEPYSVKTKNSMFVSCTLTLEDNINKYMCLLILINIFQKYFVSFFY